MNTFLPHKSFSKSARALDNRRLCKQITECEQILKALRDPDYGWQHHPAVQMWRGYEKALIVYGLYCYSEWKHRYVVGKRGGKLSHKSGQRLISTALYAGAYKRPSWLGDERLHTSHRACLLAKDPDWYGQFDWTEDPTPRTEDGWPYWWPTKE